MNIELRQRAAAASTGVTLDLEDLICTERRKTYDLYKAKFAIVGADASARLALDIRDDCVFRGDVAPLIKHALHYAFLQLVGATRTNLDDEEDEPTEERPHWSFDLERIVREDTRSAYSVTFQFIGNAKARGTLTVESAEIDNPWRAEANARAYAHELLLEAFKATRIWKLSAEALDEL